MANSLGSEAVECLPNAGWPGIFSGVDRTVKTGFPRDQERLPVRFGVGVSRFIACQVEPADFVHICRGQPRDSETLVSALMAHAA